MSIAELFPPYVEILPILAILCLLAFILYQLAQKYHLKDYFSNLGSKSVIFSKKASDDIKDAICFALSNCILLIVPSNWQLVAPIVCFCIAVALSNMHPLQRSVFELTFCLTISITIPSFRLFLLLFGLYSMSGLIAKDFYGTSLPLIGPYIHKAFGLSAPNGSVVLIYFNSLGTIFLIVPQIVILIGFIGFYVQAWDRTRPDQGKTAENFFIRITIAYSLMIVLPYHFQLFLVWVLFCYSMIHAWRRYPRKNPLFNSLACCICCSSYNLYDKFPQIIYCGHSFCAQCIFNYGVKCVECRRCYGSPIYFRNKSLYRIVSAQYILND